MAAAMIATKLATLPASLAADEAEGAAVSMLLRKAAPDILAQPGWVSPSRAWRRVPPGPRFGLGGGAANGPPLWTCQRCRQRAPVSGMAAVQPQSPAKAGSFGVPACPRCGRGGGAANGPPLRAWRRCRHSRRQRRAASVSPQCTGEWSPHPSALSPLCH
ncbi:hypothetical protein N2152v2_000336 [Parachlorella kessleri]